MSGNGAEDTDNFKPIFKFYKNNDYLKSDTESHQIIDLSNIDCQTREGIRKIQIDSNKHIVSPIGDQFHDRNEWQIYAIDSVEGLLVVPQILKRDSSKKWFNYLLHSLPFTHCNDLKANIGLPPTKPIHDSNLRWISFGYHHNWDTKMYDECTQSPIPVIIQQLFDYMSVSLGFDGFRGEAGLINYYTNGSTLCPHSDHSEPNTSAPLFSLSLGSSAIFLIGDTTKCSSKPIVALYLRDGDLLVQSSQCRQAYHAIPKVLNDSIDNKEQPIKRININMRQMY